MFNGKRPNSPPEDLSWGSACRSGRCRGRSRSRASAQRFS